jgi:hypothetical protein
VGVFRGGIGGRCRHARRVVEEDRHGSREGLIFERKSVVPDEVSGTTATGGTESVLAPFHPSFPNLGASRTTHEGGSSRTKGDDGSIILVESDSVDAIDAR